MDDFLSKLQSKLSGASTEVPDTSSNNKPVTEETVIKEIVDNSVGNVKTLIKPEKRKFYLSQSLIKEVTDHRGEYKNVCPRQVYEKYITKQFRSVTDPMMQGIYGETLMLGGGAQGQKVTDLPRHKKTGEKLTAQLNIEEQAIRFPMWCAEKGINVIPGINTQVPIVKRFNKKTLFRTEIDLFPTPFMEDDGKIHLTMIDLKMTADINSRFGNYCWGAPEYMDHIQADACYWLLQDFDMELNIKENPEKEPIYRMIFGNKNIVKMIEQEELRFYYMVVGYKAKDLENQITYIHRSYREPNGTLYRQNEFQERARKTIAQLNEWSEQDWPAQEDNYCSSCPVSELNGGYCQQYKKIKTI